MAGSACDFEWLQRDALPPLPYLTLCCTQAVFDAARRHIKCDKEHLRWVTPGASATTFVFENPEGEMVCLVCLDLSGEHTREQIASMLVHEAVHVWQNYRDDTLRERNPSRELEAYVIQRVAQNLFYELTRQEKIRGEDA